LVDDQGEVIGCARLEGEAWVFETPGPTASDTWIPKFRVNDADTVIPVAASAQAGHWWAVSNRGRDKLALVEVDLHSGTERVAHADDRVDVTGVWWSRLQKRPVAVYTEPDTQEWQAFDPALQQALHQLKGQTDARIEINNMSDNERWMSATVIRHNGGEHVL
jgi:hypothetical protein